MDINKLSIEQLVEYVNRELAKGRTMRDIEINDFKVNDRVIVKRLTRRGYKRLGNEFNKVITEDIKEVIQEDNKVIEEPKQEDIKVIENNKSKLIQKYNQNISDEKETTNKSNIIQRYNQSISDEKLMELVNLIEPIKEMLEEYNRNKNIVDANVIELRPKAITEVKQKLFKVDVDVLEQWEEFVLKHKEFKVQHLISLALQEFINKYK